MTIEDAAELKLQQPHVVRLESRPPNIEGKGQVSIRDLVRNSLRMRPDRIVVGEVRGAEALDMLQAMNTGHDGSISTIHCNSPRDALSRLETITMMAGMDLGSRAIREQIASAIQLIVYQSRLKDGTRRFTHVTEVAGMEGEVITLQDIFLFDYSAGHGRRGPVPGTPEVHGSAAEVRREAPGARRHIDPELFAMESKGPIAMLAADTFFSSQAMLAVVVALVALAAFALGWLLLGTAARVKADRDMAARMAAIGRPVPQQTASAGRQGRAPAGSPRASRRSATGSPSRRASARSSTLSSRPPVSASGRGSSWSPPSGPRSSAGCSARRCSRNLSSRA